MATMKRLKGIRGDGAGLQSVDGLIGTKLKMAPLNDVVSGIAGSGKTSLISRWVKRERLPAAWYSLDKTDKDIIAFCKSRYRLRVGKYR
jgi:hypothetical protein